MRRIKLLRAATGEYKDRNTGEMKMGYTTIGSLLEGDKGKMLKIDSIPVGFNGWVYFGDLPSDQVKKNAQPEGADFPDDDIPF